MAFAHSPDVVPAEDDPPCEFGRRWTWRADRITPASEALRTEARMIDEKIRKRWLTRDAKTLLAALAVSAVVLAAFFLIYPAEDWIVTGILEGTVQRLRDAPSWRGRTGPTPVPGSPLVRTSGDVAYVLVNDARGTQVFFPMHRRTVRIVWGPRQVESRIEADGWLYSDVPLQKENWIEVPNAHPPFEGMSTWGTPPIRSHWYAIEPFYSD